MSKLHGPEPWYWRRCNRWYVTLNGEQINLGPDEAAARAEWHRLMAGGEPRPKRRRRAKGDEEGLAVAGPAPDAEAAAAPLHRPSPDAVTLAEALDAFLTAIRPDVAERTHGWYVDHLSAFARHAGPARRLAEVSSADASRWLASAAKHSAAHRRGMVVALRRCANWLKGPGGLCSHDLAAGLKAPTPQPRDKAMTEADFSDLMAHFAGSQFAKLLAFCWHTGCRPQEAFRLDLGHADLEKGVCVLPARLAKGRRRPRVIYLNGEAAALAREEVTARHHQGHAAPLFVNRRGNRWCRHSVGCCFQRFQLHDGRLKVLAQQGLHTSPPASAQQSLHQPVDDVVAEGHQRRDQHLDRQPREMKQLFKRHGRLLSCYMARHAFITRALRAGVSMVTVAAWVGHKDTLLLSRVYSHVKDDAAFLHEQLKRLT